MAAAMILGLSLWGCKDSLDNPDMSEEQDSRNSIVLSAGGTVSRAGTIVGENDAENLISNYVIFFYNTPTGDPLYMIKGSADKVTTATVSVNMPIDKIESLFGSGDICYAYALVNLPESVEVAASNDSYTIKGEGMTNPLTATVSNINAVKVSYDFGKPEGTKVGNLPDNFVMKGESASIRLDRDNRKVSGTIDLKRVASKIRLWVKIPDVVYVTKDRRALRESELPDLTDEVVKREFEAAHLADGGQICYPQVGDGSNVKVYINNGVKMSRIDGNTKTETGTRWLEDKDYYSMSHSSADDKFCRKMMSSTPKWSEADTYPHTHEIPFYSYPNSWTVSATEEKQTSLVLLVNWRIITQQNPNNMSYTPCYYSIPVNSQSLSNPNCLESNKYYRIAMTVGMLGSFSFGEPQEIEDATWEVLNWEQENIDMTLRESKYVVFNQSDFVMNNEQRIEIPFTSSHEAEVKFVYVTYFRFNDTWGDGNNTEWTTRKNFVTQNGRTGDTYEGLISNTTYGDVYAWPGYYSDSYYVGREHPKTVPAAAVSRPNNLSATDGQAWDFYKDRYGIDSLYRCRIRDNKVVFDHPLVRWEERRRDNASTMTRPADFFVPVFNSSGTGFKDAYSRYEITIIVGLKNETSAEDLALRKTIHIVQYPALYISVSHNFGNVSTNGRNAPNNNGNEYVLINGLTTWKPEGNGSWEITGQGIFGVTNSVTQFNGTNMNPNMYVITTTQISEDNDNLYTIGDPRSLTINNNLSDNSFGANPNPVDNPANPWTQFGNNNPAAEAHTINRGTISTETEKRPIRYYYPTDETTGKAGSKENFIAPSIRVASSFGKIGSLTEKTYARRRCAAYQEAGRPAGRWRLPTKAEVLYIMNLSEEQAIPVLFGNVTAATTNNGTATTDAYYWTANGLANVSITVTGQDVTNITKIETTFLDSAPANANPAVRCVYDEWYWVKNDGSEDIPADAPRTTTFYWGDYEKDNPQN